MRLLFYYVMWRFFFIVLVLFVLVMDLVLKFLVCNVFGVVMRFSFISRVWFFEVVNDDGWEFEGFVWFGMLVVRIYGGLVVCYWVGEEMVDVLEFDGMLRLLRVVCGECGELDW